MAQQCRQQEDEAEDDQFLCSNDGDDGDGFELRQREEMVELVVYRGEVMKLRSFDGDSG